MSNMVFGFIIDSPDQIEVKMDTSMLMVSECNNCGIRALITTPNRLFVKNGELYAKWWLSSFCNNDDLLSTLDEYGVHKVDDSCDLLFMRKDPPVNSAYCITNQMLSFTKVKVINNPNFLISKNEKMIPLSSPYAIPDSTISKDFEFIDSVIRASNERMVIKPLNDKGGNKVFIVSKSDNNYEAIIKEVTRNSEEPVILQKYLEEVCKGDKRIFIVNGKPLAWMNRIPANNDFRANIHLGAIPMFCELTEIDKEICSWVSMKIPREEVPMIAIDIIGEYLSEVNITSPSGIPEINKVTGKKWEKEMINTFIDMAKSVN